MSNDQRCENCRFCDDINGREGDPTGTCRRYPPRISDAASVLLTLYQNTDLETNDLPDWQTFWESLLDHVSDSSSAVWPVVKICSHDWCGEWQRKEGEG